MNRRHPTVVVATADALHVDRTDQVVHLVDRLREAGHRPVVLLIRGGPERRRLERVADLRVADDLLPPPLSRLARRLVSTRLANGWRARRSRRTVARLGELPWILGDPEAAWFLRLAPAPPGRFFVHLGDGRQTLDGVDDEDREILNHATLWTTAERHQVDELRDHGVHSPIHHVGDLWAPARQRALAAPGPDDPVIVSTPSGSWSEVAHTIEVVAGIRRRDASTPLWWLVDPGEDRWLAQHDLGLIPEHQRRGVEIRDRARPIDRRPRLIVRTGYQTSDTDLVHLAAIEGVPTVGFAMDDLPDVPGTAVEPFAVEELVELALRLLDPESGDDPGRAFEDAMAHRLDPDAIDHPRHRLRPLIEALDHPELLDHSNSPDILGEGRR